jgi:hypothetical protein
VAITITTTIAGASSNSYVTVADASTYFEGRLDAEGWNTADEERQQQALLTAMRVLESLDFIGARSTGTQALCWPRVATTQGERGMSFSYSVSSLTVLGAGEGLYDNDGRKWLVTVIPTPVVEAQCEVALVLLQQGATWLSGAGGDLKRIRTGVVTLELGGAVTLAELRKVAMEYLTGLLVEGAELKRG